MEEEKVFYYKGYVITEAIRIFIHHKGIQPSIKDLSATTSYSKETVYFICNRLEEHVIVEVVKGAFDEKVYLKNHTRLEDLPRETERVDFREDIDKLREKSLKRKKEIERIQETEAEKKKDLFSELEKKLKGAMKVSHEKRN